MKIAFLGMSGVRVADPELIKRGLTLPGFVDRSKVIASLPSLGLLYLAAVTPSTHDIMYYETEKFGQESPELFNCDVVAISALTAQSLEAYKIADKLREAGVVVVIGGLHASVLPEEAKDHADCVVVGEGENVWPVVLNDIENSQYRKIYKASEFEPVDVTKLPTPRYDLLLGKEYNRFTVQTSRGCPWRCDFCASSVMLRQNYRKRPIENIIRDIDCLKRLFDKPFIEFADDNTFVDKRWGIELCKALTLKDVRWFTETDISLADNEELLSLMHQAGCRQVLIGLESPSNSALQGIELRKNFKAKMVAQYSERIKLIQSYGVTVNGCFILGLDNHTPSIFDEVLQFAEEVGLFEVQLTVLTPFPGTPLYKKLKLENRLIHDEKWDRCTLFDVNFKPKNMSVEELQNGLYFLTESLYSTPRVKARRDKFFRNLRKRVSEIGLDISDTLKAA
jgi:radical SAM superfamily enzyme YgiQ (UPF0313 family)